VTLKVVALIESRSDIAEAATTTEIQAPVFPAHNAHEDRARYAITRSVARHGQRANRSARVCMRGLRRVVLHGLRQERAYMRARAPTTRVGRHRGIRADDATYTWSEKKFSLFRTPENLLSQIGGVEFLPHPNPTERKVG
jgi:hypothetical protein